MASTSAHPHVLRRSLDHGAVASQRRWTCRVVPQGGRRHQLLLSGSLHEGWAGRLATGLAARHVSVVTGSARRAATEWNAEIAFDVLDPGVVPSPIDFITLMHGGGEAEPTDDLRLSGYRIARTATDLEVEIQGRDEVGFLGRILQVFASLRLFPRQMEIETIGAEVLDVFRLEGAAGQRPPEGIVAALEQRLRALAAAS